MDNILVAKDTYIATVNDIEIKVGDNVGEDERMFQSMRHENDRLNLMIPENPEEDNSEREG